MSYKVNMVKESVELNEFTSVTRYSCRYEYVADGRDYFLARDEAGRLGWWMVGSMYADIAYSGDHTYGSPDQLASSLTTVGLLVVRAPVNTLQFYSGFYNMEELLDVLANMSGRATRGPVAVEPPLPTILRPDGKPVFQEETATVAVPREMVIL